jgi:hypothetical protein
LKWPILEGKSSVSLRAKTMQQLAEYLEQAIQFGALAHAKRTLCLKLDTKRRLITSGNWRKS